MFYCLQTAEQTIFWQKLTISYCNDGVMEVKTYWEPHCMMRPQICKIMHHKSSNEEGLLYFRTSYFLIAVGFGKERWQDRFSRSLCNDLSYCILSIFFTPPKKLKVETQRNIEHTLGDGEEQESLT